MRNGFEKVFMGAAGSSGAEAGLDVDDVFSTYLYVGNGHTSSNVIANGIDLSGEGGLVWIKGRNTALNHILVDTVRGVTKTISSNNDSGQLTDANTVKEFTSTGFRLGDDTKVNNNTKTFASWTWRKAPKYFDIVTYTGSGSAKTVAHSLDSVPGMIIVKNLSVGDEWAVYHRANTAAPETDYLKLDTTAATADSAAFWNDTAPTSSVFTVGTNHSVNANNENYVAYLFAHHDGDGEFGPDSDQDIIKCGSYTGNGSNTGPVIDLGFEPQWLIIKGATIAKEWRMFDTMRGMPVGGSGSFLEANSNIAEGTDTGPVALSADGFQLTQGGSETNNNGDTYIYMAIRRGSLAPPTAGTEVFDLKDSANGAQTNYVSIGEYQGLSTIPPDMTLQIGGDASNGAHAHDISSRLLGARYLFTNTAVVEAANSTYAWDLMDQYMLNEMAANRTRAFWKRAPSFFDAVAYNGDSTASPNSRTIAHNLGVAPEMMWIKCRDAAENWAVYHSAAGPTKYGNLNLDDNFATSANWWRNTAPTSSVFTIGHQDDVNAVNKVHVAYLFATLAGISKVGSFTGNGSSQTIDCGFTSGCRFLLIRQVSHENSCKWFVFNSLDDGIVAGNDIYINLDTQQYSNQRDIVDPHSSGFIVNYISGMTNSALNIDGITHLFYAIA